PSMSVPDPAVSSSDEAFVSVSLTPSPGMSVESDTSAIDPASPSWKSPSLPLVSSVCSVDGTLLPGETLGLATGFVVSPLLVTVAPGVPSDAVALGASVGPPVVGLFTPPFTPDELPGPASPVGAEE